MTWFIVQLAMVMLSATLVILWVNWEAIQDWRYERRIRSDAS